MYGSTHITKAGIRDVLGKDDPEYSLNGNVCTVLWDTLILEKIALLLKES